MVGEDGKAGSSGARPGTPGKAPTREFSAPIIRENSTPNDTIEQGGFAEYCSLGRPSEGAFDNQALRVGGAKSGMHAKDLVHGVHDLDLDRLILCPHERR